MLAPTKVITVLGKKARRILSSLSDVVDMFIDTTQVWELSDGQQPDTLDVITYQDAMSDEQPVDVKSPVPTALKMVTETAIVPKPEKQETVSNVGIRFSPTYQRMVKLLTQFHVAGGPQVRVSQLFLSDVVVVVVSLLVVLVSGVVVVRGSQLFL